MSDRGLERFTPLRMKWLPSAELGQVLFQLVALGNRQSHELHPEMGLLRPSDHGDVDDERGLLFGQMEHDWPIRLGRRRGGTMKRPKRQRKCIEFRIGPRVVRSPGFRSAIRPCPGGSTGRHRLLHDAVVRLLSYCPLYEPCYLKRDAWLLIHMSALDGLKKNIMRRTRLHTCVPLPPRRLSDAVKSVLVIVIVAAFPASQIPAEMPRFLSPPQSITSRADSPAPHTHPLRSSAPPSQAAILACNAFARAERDTVSEYEQRRLAAVHPTTASRLMKYGMHPRGRQDSVYQVLYAACLHARGYET